MPVRKISPSTILGPRDVYVGRNARLGDPFWGNPIVLRRESDRELVLSQYEEWLRTADHILVRIDELRGCTAYCHCYPRQCHAMILLEVAAMTPEARARWRVSTLSCLDVNFEMDEPHPFG